MKKLSLLPVPLILLLNACSEAPKTARADSAKPAVAVEELTVKTREIPFLYTTTGTVHARVESQLSSQIMARVLTVAVHTGDRVQAGQTLVTLDSREIEAGYRRAAATRAEAQTAVAESDSNIAAAKAALDLTTVTSERMNDLYAKRSISQQEHDEAEAKLKTAQANYDIAKARRAELNDRLAQGSAAVDEARVSRGYTVVRAPFAGIITARNVEPGAIAVPGSPLLILETNNGYRLHADVEESRLSLIHMKEPVAVSLDAQPGVAIQGKVGELSPTSDPNAHSYIVKIDLPATGAFHSGQFGHVSFVVGNKKTLTIPASAAIEHGQLQSVLVDEGGIARTRLVTLGDKQDDQIEILSGMQPGDRVICPVPPGLADGDKVEAR